MLTTGAAVVAEDLLRYGEPATAAWVLTCTDEELVRVCTVADWLLHHGPHPASGSSMLIAKACALAAVYVHEGGPRDLARSRRGPVTGPPADSGGRRPDPRLLESVAPDHGVGEDARAFWGSAVRPTDDHPVRMVPRIGRGTPRTRSRAPRSPGPAAVLATSFHQAMAGKLAASGFVRRASGPYLIILDDDVSGWLSLATTTSPGSGQVMVMPNVGVVHSGVNHVIDELTPDATSRRPVWPTIATSLTALMPGSSTSDWIIEQDADLEPRTAALAGAVRDHALPFMHRYADLGQLVLGLRLQRGGNPESAAKRLAAALLLQGDVPAALGELDACAASIADRTDLAADDFRDFARAFRGYAEARAAGLA